MTRTITPAIATARRSGRHQLGAVFFFLASSAPRSTGRHLLKVPTIAVGIGERSERDVASMRGIWTGHPVLGPGVGEHSLDVVHHLGDVKPEADHLGSGLFDVRDDQV